MKVLEEFRHRITRIIWGNMAHQVGAVGWEWPPCRRPWRRRYCGPCKSTPGGVRLPLSTVLIHFQSMSFVLGRRGCWVEGVFCVVSIITKAGRMGEMESVERRRVG